MCWIRKLARMGLRSEPQATFPLLEWPGHVALTQLPDSYDALFQQMCLAKCEYCGKVPDEPAICLVCGQLQCAGTTSYTGINNGLCCRQDDMGEATRHAHDCGGGAGAYLLLRQSQILLISQGTGHLYGSPYLDAQGEQDIGLNRGRPLVLDQQRWAKLRLLLASSGISRFVFRMHSRRSRLAFNDL